MRYGAENGRRTLPALVVYGVPALVVLVALVALVAYLVAFRDEAGEDAGFQESLKAMKSVQWEAKYRAYQSERDGDDGK